MRYRTLGRTGLQVSILGFGASPLGGVFGHVDAAEVERGVRAALDLGINLFDVAPYYGLTRAESALGEALRGVARDSYVLATKVGRYGQRHFDFSAARVVRSCEESLQRLGVEYVDLLQCHDIEFGSLDQIIEETLPALRRLQQQGKTRFVGITGLPLTIFPAVLDRADVDCVLSYCHCTLYDTSLIGLTPYLENRGVGIVNAAPLAMGLLTEAGPPPWHPAPPALKLACAEAGALCRVRGVDIAQLATEYALAWDLIHSTLVGMATEAEVRANAAASERAPDWDLLRAVDAVLAPVRCMTWPSGQQ